MPKEKPSVAKAVQPSATLEIDGVKFELLYDYNAIADAEILTGNTCNLLHGLVAPSSISALQLRGLLLASLKPRQPGLTMAEAGKLIRLDTIHSILRAIGEAWALSMPESKENPIQAAGPGEAPSGQ